MSLLVNHSLPNENTSSNDKDKIKRKILKPSEIKIPRKPLEDEKCIFDREEIKNAFVNKDNSTETNIIPKSLLSNRPLQTKLNLENAQFLSLHRKTSSVYLSQRFELLLKRQSSSTNVDNLKRKSNHLSKDKEINHSKYHKSSHSRSSHRDYESKKISKSTSYKKSIKNKKVIGSTSLTSKASTISCTISRRSFTRSPTPIKYNYDIYQKRSPTFGRRCPVINRWPHDQKNMVKSNNCNTDSNNNNDNRLKNIDGLNVTERNLEKTFRRQNTKAPKPVTLSETPRNPSYFQHDDREIDIDRRRFSKHNGLGPKRKNFDTSPIRWQHDLFEKANKEGNANRA